MGGQVRNPKLSLEGGGQLRTPKLSLGGGAPLVTFSLLFSLFLILRLPLGSFFQINLKWGSWLVTIQRILCRAAVVWTSCECVLHGDWGCDRAVPQEVLFASWKECLHSQLQPEIFWLPMHLLFCLFIYCALSLLYLYHILLPSKSVFRLICIKPGLVLQPKYQVLSQGLPSGSHHQWSL